MGLFIIAVIVLLICVSRIGSKDLREVAVLKETLEATDRKNYYLISSDVLELNYTIMNHRNFVDNFWIGIWYDKDVAKLELLK